MAWLNQSIVHIASRPRAQYQVDFVGKALGNGSNDVVRDSVRYGDSNREYVLPNRATLNSVIWFGCDIRFGSKINWPNFNMIFY